MNPRPTGFSNLVLETKESMSRSLLAPTFRLMPPTKLSYGPVFPSVISHDCERRVICFLPCSKLRKKFRTPVLPKGIHLRKHLNHIFRNCLLSSGGVVRSSILPFRGSDRGFKFFQGDFALSDREMAFEKLEIPPGASPVFVSYFLTAGTCNNR